MRILIIEDNRDIAANIGAYMENKGHVTDFAEDGEAGLYLAVTHQYDVIVLDLMLPIMDGLVVCHTLRKEAGKDTPVIMLTARDTLDDKLQGFAAGGDDYLVKPFSLMELEARLISLQRRAAGSVSNGLLKVGDLSYNPKTLEVIRAETKIELKPTTKKILVLLMRANTRVVSRKEIEYAIWGDDLPDGDSLRAHIYSIRNVIDKPYDKQLLHTIHGVGYRLTADDA